MILVLTSFAFADDKLPYGALSKGSLSNSKLISDTKVGVAAAVATKGCSHLENFEPFVLSHPKGDPGSQYWQELWIVNGCGKKYPINIRFAEDGAGGAFWTIEK